MTIARITIVRITIALWLCGFTGLEVAAQETYPNKPITFVVGFGTGGSADRMARAMSGYVAEEMGQPIHVINKKGAGTLLAANYVLSRPHDGYTVFASSFSPYLSNTIIEGSANYTIDDFAYLNFQWFDEDLVATEKHSQYKSLGQLLETISAQPKTVKAAVVKGSTGHLMIKLLLELNGIPQENLNLVTFNNGGRVRTSIAGGVVDFMVVSATGSESIREFILPIAINSARRDPAWDAPTIQESLAHLDIKIPVLPGSMRGFATTAKFAQTYPERFAKIEKALHNAIQNPRLQSTLEGSNIGYRWLGTADSTAAMQATFLIFEKYAHLMSLE